MQKIIGKYATAIAYSNSMEEYAKSQIQMICDHQIAENSKIRIMPDVHPGKIGPIGFTMTIGDKVMPGLVGNDIGCGISYMKIKNKSVEFQKLDRVIREYIPAGNAIRKDAHRFSNDFNFNELICHKYIHQSKAKLSLGSLGGGNHFIELDRDEKQNIYVVVHSGSRYLGQEVANFYMKKGQQHLKSQGIEMPYELTYLEGSLMDAYLHDLKIVQGYAMLNREIILYELAKNMKWKEIGSGESIHNYVDEFNILRKGATAANQGDEVIIPINMKDGIILGKGKGNPDWNYSAPHGAGRILSRAEVKTHHIVSEYKQIMKGIYSSTICAGTLDEAPFAYRGLNEIKDAITDTVEIEKIIEPIYNYKAIK